MAPIKNYTPKQMGDAIEAVRGGESVAAAAKRFGVPRITLYNKISGKSPMQCSMGPTTVLTSTEEDLLVKWLLAMAGRRFPISKETLLDSVQRIITVQNKSNPFTKNRPGRKWFTSFLKRHPIIAQRTAENLTAARENVTEEEIVSWFREIHEYLTSVDLHQVLEDPSRVFNTDESAFFLSPKPGQVLVKRGEKHVYAASGDEKENLTVLVTANAAGKLAPPMIVFAYERIPANIANSVQEDWGIGKSESGWMCSETFYEYITGIFNPWLVKEQIQKPILFFVDGHKSHLTLQLSQFCSENGIELIALYPNSTHILQPMDISVFRPLKVFFRKEVIAWKMENMGNKLKKENFAPVFKKALDRITEDCVKNGFRGGGLYPFGPEYIDMTKFGNKRSTISEPNEGKDQNVKQLLKFLELQITKIFGQDKLEMYKKLYFDGRNAIENMALEEDLNLYIVWAHAKQMTTIPDTNVASSSNTLTPCYQEQEQGPRMTLNTEVILENNEAIRSLSTTTSIPTLEFTQSTEVIPNVDFTDRNTMVPSTTVTLSSTASNSVTKEQILIQDTEKHDMDAVTNIKSKQDVQPTSITDKANDLIETAKEIPYHYSTTAIDHNIMVISPDTNEALSSTALTSCIQEQEPTENTNQAFSNGTNTATSPASNQSTFEVSLVNSIEVQPNKDGCTPEKNTLSKVLGVTVPSPFKNCLFWPEIVHTKKTKRNKEKIPSAVTSKAWQQYHVKKDAEKRRLIEEKELKAKLRLEKKEFKEKMAKVKKDKVKTKKKKASEISSSEDTDMEVNYVESGESELNEQSDPNMCEEEIIEQTLERKQTTVAKKKRNTMIEDTVSDIDSDRDTPTCSYKHKKKKDLTKGCFVIVKYEGEYFPGKIENEDREQYEISTMVLSTGNTFRWPERPDKIWYKMSEVIEKICPPVKQNNRGFFKVAEMEKFLPDIYNM